MHDTTERARAYLAGQELRFDEADALWRALKSADELSLARQVLARLRGGRGLLDRLPADRAVRHKLCQQEALLTSKDTELGVAQRHDRALEILEDGFGALDDAALDGDGETLGIAGGILKRRWSDLGQLEDLRRAARCYQRGARGGLGDDGYAHINAAFADELLAKVGDDAAERRARAAALRARILRELPAADQVPAGSAWFNAATRAEALLGERRYAEAARVIAGVGQRPVPWALETTARQLATIAHLNEPDPLAAPEVRAFFEALLPGAADAARSAVIGKVGLAQSGGGFRAAFYHLGVLARLAELNVLRHVDVLSCVSGGSIVGACYWLALRRRLLRPQPMTHEDYLELVGDLIAHFRDAVATDLRGAVQPSKARVAWRLLSGEKGALDPEATALALERHFYRPLLATAGRPLMHELPFTPTDHDPVLTGSDTFHPGRHNWLRGHKVPALVLNATTVNTGHGWQFTPTWMGESPWAVHPAADSVPRLEWGWYAPQAGWQIELGRAVAASACVPLVFAPLALAAPYDDLQVHLVDGGVHDNQGTVSLLGMNCNVLLVSDACGQLLLEPAPAPGLKGLAAHGSRAMDTLMERVRLANYADLDARRRSGLLRALMFVHMKSGLDADPIRLRFSQDSSTVERSTLSLAGIRKDFQQALAELRTDLDAFTPDESNALMACGYRMAAWSFARELSSLRALWDPPVAADWPFADMLQEISSTAPATPARDALLAALREGRKVRLD